MNHLTVKILLLCFCATLFSLYNLSYKNSHNGNSFISYLNSPSNANLSPLINVEKNSPSHNCLIYGPISSENKKIIDILLNKANINNLFNIIDKPVYEVYWNLGSDKIKAIELFEVQKNDGPLKEEKYRISLNEYNDWVVRISSIIANEKMAQDLATNLAIKASKINTGGKWQYKNKSSVYFYQSENANKIPNEVGAVIEKTFLIPKSLCQ